MEGFSGAAQVRGTCLLPRVAPGSWVLYDTRRVAQPGDIVVLTDGDQVVVKLLHEWEGERWVAPIAGRAPYRLEPPHRVLGVVLQIMHPP
jgi:SOS-response transcriptional repressor LexA